MLYDNMCTYFKSIDTLHVIVKINKCIRIYISNHSFDRPPSSGGRLNKKDGLTRYGDSHVKDKTS